MGLTKAKLILKCNCATLKAEMKKVLASIFFTLVFLSFPYTVSAFYADTTGTGDFSQYRFAINANNVENPQDKLTNTSDIIFDITAWDNSGAANAFKTDENHYIRLEKPGYRCLIDFDFFSMTTLPYGFSALSKPQSPSQVIIKFSPKKNLISGNWACNLESGTYKLSMWSKKSKTFVFQNVDLPVDSQVGGDDPSLQHVSASQNLICKELNPKCKTPDGEDGVAKVIAKNITKGKTYRIWWDGHVRKWAWKGEATGESMTICVGPGDVPLIQIATDTFFAKNATNYLCLAEGDTSLTPAIAPKGQCSAAAGNAYLPFYYPEDQSVCTKASEQKCEARVTQAANNTGKKRVSILGSNLKLPVSDLAADLVNQIDNSTNTHLDALGSDMGQGSDVNWTLELSKGNYYFHFYGKDGTDVCDGTFVVNDKVETGNTASNATPSFEPTQCIDGKCATSSGEYCDAARRQLRTAIGCIPVDPGLFVAGLMKYITGFAGGVALLLMVFGAFQMVTSAGNAENLKKGREQFVSAVIGLLFVIFATLLMQVVGVDILGLPGFTK